MDLLAGASATILGSLAMLSVPAYFVLQTWLTIVLKGRWRMWALLPLLFAVPLFAWCMAALWAESNLWPLPFILFAPMGTIYLAIVFTISRASRAGSANGTSNP